MKLRFTIRDLLWLAVVAAVAAAWQVDRQRLSDPGLPSLRLYPTKSASASEIAAFLSPALTAENQSIHIGVDERTNSIAVLATANQHVAIAKMISDLDAKVQGLKAESPPAR